MTDPADDTTGIAEAVHAESARLRAEDGVRRIKVVVGVLLRFVELRDLDDNDRKEADDLARAILAALNGVA